MATTPTPAVVLSGNLGAAPDTVSLNEAALALTRSLGRRGVPVFRFHPDRMLADLRSRYATHVPCPNLYDDPRGLADALVAFARAQGTRPVLFPASDGAAQFIAEWRAALEDHFLFSSPDAARIGKAQDKRVLIETAEAAGIPVPKTFFPTDPAELPAIAKSLSYPLIVKPIYSPDWKRTAITSVFGRIKALTVTGPEQLIEQGTTLIGLKSAFMVQEIVPGPDENLVTFLGYVGHEGEVLAASLRKKLRQFPPGFGYCCLTESVVDSEIRDLAIGLFGVLDYRGIGCIEFKRDPRDGRPKLIEINTRAVRTSMLAIGAGVDFPWIAYQDCVRPGSVAPVLGGAVAVRWVHLRDELWAASKLMRSGELSPVVWAKGFLGKKLVIAEFSWDDMRPGLITWAQVPGRVLRLLLNRGRGPVAPPSTGRPARRMAE